MIEVIAQLKHLRMPPKKIRLVGDSIKGMSVDGALVHLKYMQKKSAPIVLQLLNSAIANALHNKEISADKLIVKNVLVDEGLALKRWIPAAHGSAHPFKKRGSHVKIILTLKPGVTIEPKKEKKRSEKKDVEKKPESSAKRSFGKKNNAEADRKKITPVRSEKKAEKKKASEKKQTKKS